MRKIISEKDQKIEEVEEMRKEQINEKDEKINYLLNTVNVMESHITALQKKGRNFDNSNNATTKKERAAKKESNGYRGVAVRGASSDENFRKEDRAVLVMSD